jgi:transformation/transcription domain-associated protein
MIKNLLQTLSSGEPAFNKDSQDYQFRRVLLEIIHRIPYSDAVRNSGYPIFQGMIHLLTHDNEENGVTACKTIIDLIRSHRILKPEVVSELMSILRDLFRNMQGLVEETLSEDSAVVNPNVVLPSLRSFKVLAEMGLVIVTCLQQFRQVIAPTLPPTVPLCFEVLALEVPMQRKAREDFEAMGGHWAGMTPSIKNAHAYTDFIAAQIKVCCSSAEIISIHIPLLDGVLSRIHHAGFGRAGRSLRGPINRCLHAFTTGLPSECHRSSKGESCLIFDLCNVG